MDNALENHSDTGSNILYLLSFVDSIDRLDTIILEIRHLQTTIIYNLREPLFFSILKKEEKYIWETELEEELNKLNTLDQFPSIDLIQKWIPAFPPYSNYYHHNTNDNFNPNDEIRQRLQAIRKDTLWSGDQDIIYHSLVSLQQLKRDVVKDKLILCRFAYEANIHTACKPRIKHSKPIFMIARAAIMSKVGEDYIDRLFEYRQQMEFFADLSSEAMPQSSIKRRREIELYSNFLAERTRTMRTDFSLLLYQLGFDSARSDDYLILHNWHHKYVSQSRSHRMPYNDIRPNYSSHISSHFWTPERPDLQPIIAHEVAHIFIKSEGLFSDLKNHKLSSEDNEFSSLLRKIIRIITNYIDDYDEILGLGFADPQTITREMACDFLASSIKGQSFLYAHFLESFGFQSQFIELANNLDGDTIDPTLISTAKFSLTGEYADDFSWYLRTLSLTTWAKSTWVKDTKNYLDNDLIEGVEKIADDILDYYREISVFDQDREAIHRWKEMTDEICDLIESNEGLCDKIKKHKREREKDQYANGDKNFPKRTERLDYRVRNSLYLMQIWMKTTSSRPFEGKAKEEAECYFNRFYIGSNENQHIIKKDCYKTPPLYKYIHDIPWQCSLMRAKDMYWCIDKESKVEQRVRGFNNFLHEVTELFPLGRDLFSYALEFHLFSSDLPSDRLKLFKSLIVSVKSKESKTENLIKNDLSDIIGIKLVEEIFNHRELNSKREPSALNIVILEKERRNYESLSEAILKKVFNKLKLNLEAVTLNESILSLYCFLLSRNDSEKYNDNNPINTIRSSFLFFPLKQELEKCDAILDAFDNQKILYKSYLITKIVISATNSNQLDADTEYCSKIKDITHEKDNMWRTIDNKLPEEITRYHKRLGRNDILAVSSTTSLCRCKIPTFNVPEPLPKDGMPLFISRRELAIPVRLGSKQWSYINSTDKNKEPTPLAAISLSLKQPSFRLSFIYRLIESIKQKNKWGKSEGSYLECIGDRFSVENDDLQFNDCAFLTDGRDDLLIIFADTSDLHGNRIIDDEDMKAHNILERINNIFEIQNALYQDFMVDRTRLYFMPQALNIFKDEKARNDYRATIKIRLKEDRTLDLSNKKMKAHGIKGLYKSPGQYDYEIDMDSYFIDGICPNMLEILSKEILTAPYIDYTETQILKKWEDD